MNKSGKALKKAFASCFFDPRKPGTLATIVECNDPSYLLNRGLEMLRDAKQFSGPEKWAKIRDAVAVLTYTLIIDDWCPCGHSNIVHTPNCVSPGCLCESIRGA